MHNDDTPPRQGMLSRAIGALATSLRAQLFAWVVLTLIGAICINLYLSFRSADATSKLVTDHTLLASARVIAEAVRVDASGTVQIDIPPAALEMFDTGYGDRVFYQVVTAWGNLVAGFPDLPRPGRDRVGEDKMFRTDDVRVLMLSHPVVGLDQDGTISVAVAVTHNSPDAMRRTAVVEPRRRRGHRRRRMPVILPRRPARRRAPRATRARRTIMGSTPRERRAPRATRRTRSISRPRARASARDAMWRKRRRRACGPDTRAAMRVTVLPTLRWRSRRAAAVMLSRRRRRMRVMRRARAVTMRIRDRSETTLRARAATTTRRMRFTRTPRRAAPRAIVRTGRRASSGLRPVPPVTRVLLWKGSTPSALTRSARHATARMRRRVRIGRRAPAAATRTSETTSPRRSCARAATSSATE